MELSTATNKNGRINLLTDGEFRFAVSAFVYRSFPYRDGDEVTEENLEVRVLGGFIVCLPHKLSVEVRGS